MKKSLFFILLIAIAFINGCSGEKSEEKNSLVLPDENGKEVQFENMEEPALVFFFTGVG